jgi:phosphotransferase system HPr (HPr) family protein
MTVKAIEDGPASSAGRPETQHGAMSGETLQRRVTIVNPQGFHMRPQSLFVQCANQYGCTVTLSRGEQRVNGKSQWELMLLAAEPGTELLLEVNGPDAPAALEALTQILAAPQADEPPLPPKG